MEHLYIVVCDISDPKRWRRVFKLMRGYGEWVQLSVFQCRLSRRRHADLVARLDGMIDHVEDHLVLVDIGVADGVEPRVVSRALHDVERKRHVGRARHAGHVALGLGVERPALREVLALPGRGPGFVRDRAAVDVAQAAGLGEQGAELRRTGRA